jgi:outer membrane protein TolC
MGGTLARRSVLVAASLGAGMALASGGRAGGEPEAPREPAPRPVTLERARAAVEQAPGRAAAAARRAAAALAVPAAGAWPATTLALSSTRATERLALVASLPLPVFGTLGASRAVARAELEVARREESSADLTLRRDVTRAWIELARAETRADRSALAAEREAELARITQSRFAAGDASRAERVGADAAARRAHARASADRTAIAASSAELAALLGWETTALLHAQGGLPAPGPVPPLEPLRSRRAGHPDARAALARAEAQAAAAGQAHKGIWPALSLDLESRIDDPTLPGNDYRVGLTLELPIFGKTGASTTAAEARRAAALAEREQTLSGLDGALVAAHRRFEAARALALELERDAVPAQRDAAALARAAFREGQGSLAAVLEADGALADAEAEAVEAEADAALARADLDWAVGAGR